MRYTYTRGGGGHRAQRGADLRYNMELTLEEAVAMFEPKTLPTAVSVFPSQAAVAETIVSGAAYHSW